MDARTLTWPEVKALASRQAIALVPIGSTEAHGPHLPLCTDVVIAEEVCRRVEAALAARQVAVPCVRFPAVSYSQADFAAGFAGTVSVRPENFTAHLVDVVTGIVAHGFSTALLINHHLEPAHFRQVHQAAKQAAERTGARVLVPDHRKGPRAQALGEEFLHGGSHAGQYETSLMLAAAPELVRDAVRRQLPDLDIDLPARIKAGNKTFESCGGPDAYFGSPRSADRDEGERLFELLVAVALESLDATGP